MKHSILPLSAPAVLAVLLALPSVVLAASHGEVASPTAFQPLATAEADTPACRESLVSCGHRAAASLLPPEGASPRGAYTFSDETFSFDSGVDIMLLTASTREPSGQGAHMEWRWRLAYRRLGPDHFRLIQIGIQYRCGSGKWLRTPCRPTGPVNKTVMSDFGASDVVARSGDASGVEAFHSGIAAVPQAASTTREGAAGVDRSDGSITHTGRRAERRRAAKDRLGLEGLEMFDEEEAPIQYRMPPTSPDAMRSPRGFMPLALGADGSPATTPCEKPIDLCGQQVLDEVYSSDSYGRLLPEQIRHESFVYGDEEDGVIRAVYLVTLVDLPDDIIEGERVRIGFVRRDSAWVAVSAGRQVRCHFGYARTEWRGEICTR